MGEETLKAFGIDMDPGCVCVFDKGATKRQALDVLIDAVVRAGGIDRRDEFEQAVHQREAVKGTDVGDGVALPHIRFAGVQTPQLAVGVSPEGIDYGALDKGPVHILVLFVTPEGSGKGHLALLARMMVSLKEPAFRAALTACVTSDELAEALSNGA